MESIDITGKSVIDSYKTKLGIETTKGEQVENFYHAVIEVVGSEPGDVSLRDLLLSGVHPLEYLNYLKGIRTTIVSFSLIFWAKITDLEFLRFRERGAFESITRDEFLQKSEPNKTPTIPIPNIFDTVYYESYGAMNSGMVTSVTLINSRTSEWCAKVELGPQILFSECRKIISSKGVVRYVAQSVKESEE